MENCNCCTQFNCIHLFCSTFSSTKWNTVLRNFKQYCRYWCVCVSICV